MTDREKAIVMAYTGKCMLTEDKFHIFHEYVEEIMGRPVFTHELADKDVQDKIKEKAEDDFIALCEEEEPFGDMGNVSDGYHTFNQLYYQRMMLFAALVKQNRDKAWKSLRHEDGELCFGGGWFIVGIDTPKGSYTYHFEDNYFSLFDCEELEKGKHWDGHTEKDVIRLLSLEKKQCEDAVSRKELINKLEIVDKMYGSDFYWEMRRLVDKLSPVTPVQKKGKWIKRGTEEKIDWLGDEIEVTYYKCSECGIIITVPLTRGIENYPYCHCGSKNEVEE